MNLSVIICTHNPRCDYLVRTLDALKAQTLPKEQWELLLIDNASKEPLAGQWDLSWHPHARHIREEELGLTPARLRGIREAAAEILVFVDDDNILSSDYLNNALIIMLGKKWLGACGGNIVGEFETKPESWAEVMFPYLALTSVKHEEWAFHKRVTNVQSFTPCGAGMVIRKVVADYYVKSLANDPLRRSLDRKGASLVSCGDIDMSLCSCVLDLAVGRFPQLQMTHLIPAQRLQREYLLQLAEGSGFSDVVLKFIWNGHLPGQKTTHAETCRSERIFKAYKSFRNRFRKPNPPSFSDEFIKAWSRGAFRASQILQSSKLEIR